MHRSMRRCWATLIRPGLCLWMVMEKMESGFMIRLEKRLAINAENFGPLYSMQPIQQAPRAVLWRLSVYAIWGACN